MSVEFWGGGGEGESPWSFDLRLGDVGKGMGDAKNGV